MITARLTDHIWSTRKAESLNGLKLMQAEIIGGGTDTGKKIIVVDIISAGIGDRVVVTTGSSAGRSDPSHNVLSPEILLRYSWMPTEMV